MNTESTTILIVIIMIIVLSFIILFMTIDNSHQHGGGSIRNKSVKHPSKGGNMVYNLMDESLSAIDNTVNNFSLLSDVEDMTSDIVENVGETVTSSAKNASQFFNVNDLLPSETNNKWMKNMKLPDNKLINTNRCISLSTKKSSTRDIRGDIPIPKVNTTWNSSPVEPYDIITNKKLE